MYAVIDTETTGLNAADDRIIELAIIGLDVEGNTEWEWCSLINPERDTGSGLVRQIHQIYPRDVADAPRFGELAGHVAEILRGRVLIAHNARFDLGMLGGEFGRLGVRMPSLAQICTADLARDCGFRPWGLHECCEVLGIEPEGAHHALADARATLSLAHKLFDFAHDGLQREIRQRLTAHDPWPILAVAGREPLTRPIFPCRKQGRNSKSSLGCEETSPQTVAGDHVVPVIETFSIDHETPESRYLAAVEWALEDRVISPQQRKVLEDLRKELCLTDEQVRTVNMTFLRGLAGSMWDDGEISKHEKFDLEVVGKALQLSESDVRHAVENPLGLDLINADYQLQAGARIVFTGEMSASRAEWTARAKTAGLRVTGSVSGKTDYLVVPFGETGSSKSIKARAIGVRVVSEQRFLRMIKRLESAA